MSRFRVSYEVEAEEVSDILGSLNEDQIATFRLEAVGVRSIPSTEGRRYTSADISGALDEVQTGLARAGLAKPLTGMHRAGFTRPGPLPLQSHRKAATQRSVGRPRKETEPTEATPREFKVGSAVDLMLKMIRKAAGEPVTTTALNQMLRRHQLSPDTKGVRRLIERGLIKRSAPAEYVWIGD